MPVLITFILLILGLLLANAAHRSARRGQRLQSKPARPAPPARVRTAVVPITSPAKTPPHPKAIAAFPQIDLSCLQPAPPDSGYLTLGQAARHKTDAVPDMAYRIAEQIRSRKILMDALSRPVLDPRELSDFAMADPALAGEILRVVNSPYYAFRSKIASIFRAVLLLGHIEIRNIVWRTCFRDLPGTVSDGPMQRVYEDLWRHAFETARLAYALARSFDLHDADIVATAALLHDVGKIIHLSTCEEAVPLYRPIRPSGDPELMEEFHVLGITHTERGGQATSVWGLPEETVAAIRHHHAPSYVTPQAFRGNQQTVLVVHLANLLWHLSNSKQAPADRKGLYLPQDGWLQLVGAQTMEDVVRKDPVARALRPRIAPAA